MVIILIMVQKYWLLVIMCNLRLNHKLFLVSWDDLIEFPPLMNFFPITRSD